MVPSAPSSDAGSDFETEEIPVSAIVVAAKSRVLEAMLFNGMKESDKTKPVTVRFTASGKKLVTCECTQLIQWIIFSSTVKFSSINTVLQRSPDRANWVCEDESQHSCVG